MKKTKKKINSKPPEAPKVGRKRTFSVSLRTRPLRSSPDFIDVQIIIKLPNDLNGKKLSTGIKCPRDMIDTKTWKIRQNDTDTNILQTMRDNIKRAYLANISSGKRTNHQYLFDSAFGIAQNSKISVIQAIERFLAKEYLSKSSEWKQATAIKNQQRINALKQFLNEKFKEKDVHFDQLKPQTADDLLEWAKISRNNGTDTAVRLVKLLKRVINFAIANEWTTYNPFLAVRFKMDEKQITALNEKEIDALINLKLNTKIMSETRDLFVFSIFTCLAFAELKNLQYRNIKVVAGKKTIIIHRQKRGNSRSVVPILEQADKILKKYEPLQIHDETPCFSVPTNQSCNRVLKELAAMANINKVITWHTARKSGATFLLNKGVPIETVQAILGHKSVKITQQYYAEMHDETIIKTVQNIDFSSKKH